MACPDWCDGSCHECLNLEDEMVKCPGCGRKEICENRSRFGDYICDACKEAEQKATERFENDECECGRKLDPKLGLCAHCESQE